MINWLFNFEILNISVQSIVVFFEVDVRLLKKADHIINDTDHILKFSDMGQRRKRRNSVKLTILNVIFTKASFSSYKKVFL